MLLKLPLYIIITIIVSLYYFPLGIRFMPSLTTKTIIAVIGLVILLCRQAIGDKFDINKDAYTLVGWATGVSVIGLISVTFNDTPDYTYVTYVISMLVWASAAYFVCICIKMVHGYISIELIGNYLIAVCVAQCVLALLIDFNPMVRAFAISIMGPQDWIESVNRLYGIGAALDTAGIRFSVVLIIIAFMLSRMESSASKMYMWTYLFVFILITIIGNMIARTTTVGLVLGIAYLMYVSEFYKFRIVTSQRKVWKGMIICLCLSLPVFIYYYHTNVAIHKYTLFAFEGFFSLFETGEWEVGSNEKLKSMYVFPESLKTWIIGDGYIVNPVDVDPYYTGNIYEGYYMGTDVGYLRFIYYFGLIGLMVFSIFIYKSYGVCCKRYADYKNLFFLLLLLNFIVWLKVSTDVFLIFALFLMMNEDVKRKNDKRILASQ